MDNNNMKKFKLLKDFIHPSFTIRAGVIKTADEWCWGVFDKDYDDTDMPQNTGRSSEAWCMMKNDWFEEVGEETDFVTAINQVMTNMVKRKDNTTNHFFYGGYDVYIVEHGKKASFYD